MTETEIKKKMCVFCKVVKPVSDYHKDKTHKFGCRSRCKPCELLRKKNQSPEIKTRQRAYGYRWRLNQTFLKQCLQFCNIELI